jgi:hypothetical protein
MKHLFYWLHAILALIGLGVCGVLLTATSGHPPGVLLYLASLVGGLVAVSYLLLISQRIKSFFTTAWGYFHSWPIHPPF